MGILKALKTDDSPFLPYLNTGMLMDVATGAMVPGNSYWVLNGGIAPTTGIAGRGQRYKSTQAISALMGALGRYKGSEGVVIDTENSIPNENRLHQLGDPHYPVDDDNIELKDSSNMDLAATLKYIRKIAEEKMKIKKDLMVETPFINPRTGKPLQIMLPTIICVDSISRAEVFNKSDELYTKHSLGDSGLNTVYMQEGNAKTQFIRQLPGLAVRAGIYFIVTAHIGDKFELNPFAKSQKDLQYMKGSDTIKGTGSQFNFLMSLLLDSRATEVQQDSKKKCKYPASFSEPLEVSKVSNVIVRCKNNISGTIVPNMVSQHQGVLRDVSNYGFVMDENMFGLEGSKQTQNIPWLPDKKFGRTTIREMSEKDYEIHRSIEILAQMAYIRNYWSAFAAKDLEIDTKINPSAFVKAVLKGGDNFISDIVNSRGHWTYDKEDPRKYMSIFDILHLLLKHK